MTTLSIQQTYILTILSRASRPMTMDKITKVINDYEYRVKKTAVAPMIRKLVLMGNVRIAGYLGRAAVYEITDEGGVHVERVASFLKRAKPAADDVISKTDMALLTAPGAEPVGEEL